MSDPHSRRWIHLVLIPVPIICFAGTLLSDLAYWATAEIRWADASAWLVTVGLIMGLLAAIAGLADFLSRRVIRRKQPAWFHATGNAVVLLLALFNTLVHGRDAWTSVVPFGLILSAATVAVVSFTGWMGWTLAHDPEVAE